MASTNFQQGTVITSSWLNDVNDAVYNKVYNFVTPEQYGAIGDNTTNDYSALQTAFNSGKPVYLAKQYFTNTTLTLPNNLTLFGDGANSMIRGDGPEPVCVANGTAGTHISNIIVRDVTIKRSHGTYATSRQLFELIYTDDSIIENVVFDGDNSTSAYPGSLIGYSVNRVQITGCHFINGAGCSLTSKDVISSNPFSTGCVVKNCYMAPAPSQGFDFYYVNDLIVDSCIAHGRTSTYGCGFIIEYQGRNITFTNCISYDNTRSGFYYEPNIAYGLASVTFDNCIAYNNGETGLYSQNSFGLTVTGGVYWGSLTSFTGSNAGITLEESAVNCVITGAYIHSNQVAGLRMARGNAVSITGNVFFNNNGPAIKITGISSNVYLSGNTFTSNVSTVTGWVENQTGIWPDGPWTTYTPIVYSNNGTSVVAISNNSVKYKRVGSVCHVEGYFEFSGSANNSVMYIEVPFTVGWSGSNTGPDAKTMRGTARGNSTGMVYVDSIYYNNRLAINGLGVGDTNVRFTATFEIA